MQHPPTSSQASSQEGHVADLLSAYIDNRLTPVERLKVGAHLPNCSSCRAQLASLQSAVALLHELPVVPAPRPFYVYAEQLPAPRAVGVLQRLFGPGWVYGYLRLATTVAALLLVAVVSVDALGLSAPRAASPAPAGYRGAVQAEVTPVSGSTMDSTETAPSASAPPKLPTEPPKAAAPMTALAAPSAGAPTPGPALPMATEPTSAPAPPAGTPPAGAGAANEVLTAQPSASPAGKGLAPATAATSTPPAEPASAKPTPPTVLAEVRPTQAPPSPTAGPAPQALLSAPAAPTPAQQSASARPTALPEPVSVAPMLADSPGVSPVRLSEIGLGALVVMLLALTLYARRGRRPAVRD